jgi:hypothetical protein
MKELSFFVSSKYDMSFKVLGDLYLEQHTRFFEINQFLTVAQTTYTASVYDTIMPTRRWTDS